MSPEKQRIAIAEACGWRIQNPEELRVIYRSWIPPGKQPLHGAFYTSRPPDYLTDLNAMHEAEKVLTPEHASQFAACVEAVVENHVWLQSGKSDEVFKRQVCMNSGDPRGRPDYDILFTYVHATAAQRAEAFLRTIGKWEDA